MAITMDWTLIEGLIKNAVDNHDFSNDFVPSEIIESKNKKSNTAPKDIQLKSNGVPKVIMVIIKELAKNLMERQDNKIDELENKYIARIEKLEKDLRETENHLDAQSQYDRRDNIKICGIEQKDEESTNEIIQKVAEFIGEPIEASDISISHRIPPRKTENVNENVSESAVKHPAIICKFVKRETRNRVIRAKRQMTLRPNNPYPDAFICEDVTPLRSRIMYQLRNKDEKKAFKSIWSIDGRIYCRTPEQAEKAAEARRKKQPEPKATVINNPSDLLNLGWSEAEIELIRRPKPKRA